MTPNLKGYKLIISDGTLCLRRSTAATFRSTRANQYYLPTPSKDLS